MRSDQRLLLIAAVARNGVIGNGPDIPWHLPGEQRMFKELTLGHTLVMGRTTYDSIGRPLPGRSTVVLTRDRDWSADGVQVAHSLDEALALAAGLPGEVMVAGGGQVYAEAMPRADGLWVTEVPLEPHGDAFFPAIDPAVWAESGRESYDGFERVHYRRRQGSDAGQQAFRTDRRG